MYKTLHLLLKKLQVDRENTVYFTIQTQHTILQSFFLNILQQIGFLILTHQGENVDFVGFFPSHTNADVQTYMQHIFL